MADVMINLSDTFDFSTGTVLKKLEAVMVKGDAKAHKVSVTCKRGSTAADLSGMICSGLLVNRRKATVPANGTIVGSVATVEFPASWYAVEGPALVLLKLTGSGTDTTIFDAYTTIQDGATDVYYDPDDLVPSLALINAALTEAINSQDVLEEKYLWADGDSLTFGFGVPPEPETGIIPSYSFLAARRCGMDYHNGAIGGSTMAFSVINGGDFYSFTNPTYPRYANIPVDADYISLYFGQNDYVRGPNSARDTYCEATYADVYDNLTTEQKALVDAHSDFVSEFIGTEGTLDIHTWIGAWEVVFQWLMAERPEAIVGIIIPELPDDDLGNGERDSLIALCARYSYPYLDAANRNLWLDSGQFPLYSTDPIKVARKALYTSDNIHPNALGHQIQSVQFEGWLRSGFITGGAGSSVSAPEAPGESENSPWRSIVCDIRPDGAGATDPVLATFYSVLSGYLFDVADQVWLRFKIPHDYTPGTDIYFALDWNHISAGVTGGSMTFQIDFAYGKAHADAGGFGNVYSIGIVSNAGVWYQLMTGEVVISDDAGASKLLKTLLEPDGIILMRLIVTANNMTGEQPGVFIHKASVNYESTNLGTPNRNPDFRA